MSCLEHGGRAIARPCVEQRGQPGETRHIDKQANMHSNVFSKICESRKTISFWGVSWWAPFRRLPSFDEGAMTDAVSSGAVPMLEIEPVLARSSSPLHAR